MKRPDGFPLHDHQMGVYLTTEGAWWFRYETNDFAFGPFNSEKEAWMHMRGHVPSWVKDN